MAPDSAKLLLVFVPVVTIAVLAAHWPALSARALSFDDDQYLTQNPLVQHPSWSATGRFLGEVRRPSTVAGYYQPLAMISLMLDTAMGGSPEYLRPYHRTSLALHVLNTALIIWLLYRLFGNPWAAALVGLLFGVHPLTVEPIPWIGERKTLLATCFALGSLIAYVRYTRTRGWGTYAGALGLYVLALMSKPTVTPLPLLMLLLDYWPLRRLNARAVIEKLPLLAVTAVSAVITVLSQRATAGVVMPGEYATPLRIPYILAHNIVFYLLKVVFPYHLSPHYPFPEPLSPADPMVALGIIGTVALLVGLVLSLRWTRALLASWLFFFIAILPTMGIIGFTIVIASDKYVYFPMVGFLLLLACGLERLTGGPPGAPSRAVLGPGPRLALAMLLILLAGAEAAATRHYLGFWQDTETLYQRMIALAPRSALLHYNLANGLSDQGRIDEAVGHYRRALEIKPAYVDARKNLGLRLAERGLRLADRADLEAAAREYKEVLRLQPGFAPAVNNLALVHNELGVLLSAQGQVAEAASHYQQAVQQKPDWPDARHNLALALVMLERLDEASGQYRELLARNSEDADAHAGLGGVLARQGRTEAATREYREALRLDPSHAAARKGLASLPAQ